LDGHLLVWWVQAESVFSLKSFAVPALFLWQIIHEHVPSYGLTHIKKEKQRFPILGYASLFHY
jgi:hypothetical protein